MMNGVALLMAAAVLGVDYGWQPTADGQLEYIVQIEPVTLVALRGGQELVSQIDPYVRNVRRFRVRVGTELVPRRGMPPRQPVASAPLPVPTGVQYGWQGIDSQQMEFIIQISPDRLALMRSGEDLVGEIPAEVQNIARLRVRSGVEPVPRQGLQVASATVPDRQSPAKEQVREIPATVTSSNTAQDQNTNPTSTVAGPPIESPPRAGLNTQPKSQGPLPAGPGAASQIAGGLPAVPDQPKADHHQDLPNRRADPQAPGATGNTLSISDQPPAGANAPSNQTGIPFSDASGPAASGVGTDISAQQRPAPTVGRPSARAQDSVSVYQSAEGYRDAASHSPASPSPWRESVGGSVYGGNNAIAVQDATGGRSLPTQPTPPTVQVPQAPETATGARSGWSVIPQQPPWSQAPGGNDLQGPLTQPDHSSGPLGGGYAFTPAGAPGIGSGSGNNLNSTASTALLPWERRLMGDDSETDAAIDVTDFWADLAATANDPSLAYLHTDSTPADGPRPWGPLALTLMILFVSLGGNLYMGWIAVDMYRRYLDIADDLAEQDAPERSGLNEDPTDDEEQWGHYRKRRARASLAA
jgi:hypothetical protein